MLELGDDDGRRDLDERTSKFQRKGQKIRHIDDGEDLEIPGLS